MTKNTTQTLEKSFSVFKNKVPLIIENTRVLRPSEYKMIYNAIPKRPYQTFFQTALLTGLRYIELQRFQKHRQWFDGEFIHLPEEAVLKQERKQKRRVVILNPLARTVVGYFLDITQPLPVWQTWKDNLRRWAVNGQLDPININVKTTRKTWESWLFASYPNDIIKLTLSQGHTSITALQHYMVVGFNEQDKVEMREYVDGWK